MRARRHDVTIFVGPSGFGLPATTWEGARVLPPAKRGDILSLVESDPPAVLVICDGTFQSGPAVSHAELCHAMDRGWRVWGVASIGAIRAYELRHEGMRGFGYVRSLFDRPGDFRDDEMCLLHLPEPPYEPVSEPLVHLRYALHQRASALKIGAIAQRKLINGLCERWFGERTLELMRTLMVEQCGLAPAVADALLEWLVEHRVKSIDLAALMRARPWTAR